MRIRVAALLLLVLSGCKVEPQPAVLRVCQVIDRSRLLNDQVVTVRGFLDGSFRHGIDLYERPDGNIDPCQGWPRKFLTCPSVIILHERREWTSLAEWAAMEALHHRLHDLYEEEPYRPMEVEITGKIRRKWLMLIWRDHSGMFHGNGYGRNDGYGVLLGVQSIRQLTRH